MSIPALGPWRRIRSASCGCAGVMAPDAPTVSRREVLDKNSTLTQDIIPYPLGAELSVLTTNYDIPRLSRPQRFAHVRLVLRHGLPRLEGRLDHRPRCLYLATDGPFGRTSRPRHMLPPIALRRLPPARPDPGSLVVLRVRALVPVPPNRADFFWSTNSAAVSANALSLR
jgi:hypothetical protein